MKQNGTENQLSSKQLRAAALVAADELSDEQIAETVGVGRTTLHRWKSSELFEQAVLKAIERMDQAALRFAVARRDKRLHVLDDLLSKALAVLDARATAYGDDTTVPGGSTGLVLKDVKGVGSGAAAIVVDTHGVDTSLISEIRGILDDAAKEVGARSQNVNLNGALTSTVELVGISAEDI